MPVTGCPFRTINYAQVPTRFHLFAAAGAGTDPDASQMATLLERQHPGVLARYPQWRTESPVLLAVSINSAFTGVIRHLVAGYSPVVTADTYIDDFTADSLIHGGLLFVVPQRVAWWAEMHLTRWSGASIQARAIARPVPDTVADLLMIAELWTHKEMSMRSLFWALAALDEVITLADVHHLDRGELFETARVLWTDAGRVPTTFGAHLDVAARVLTN